MSHFPLVFLGNVYFSRGGFECRISFPFYWGLRAFRVVVFNAVPLPALVDFPPVYLGVPCFSRGSF